MSEFVGGDQVLRFVDAEPGADAPVEGSRLPLSGSFCARVLDGRFPRLMPNTREVPDASLLDVTAQLYIGAYVGVPLLGATGAVTGMLCAVDGDACPALDARDVTALQLLHDLQQRTVSAADALAEREALSGAVDAVLAGHRRSPVLQPIVDLTSGRVVAAEGLTSFSARSPSQPVSEPDRSAAQRFDDAAGWAGVRSSSSPPPPPCSTCSPPSLRTSRSASTWGRHAPDLPLHRTARGA